MDLRIRAILGDRVSLERAGVLDMAGMVNGLAAATLRLPYAELWGQGGLTTTAAEDTDQPSATFVDDSLDVTVARRSKRYDQGEHQHAMTNPRQELPRRSPPQCGRRAGSPGDGRSSSPWGRGWPR